MQDMRTPINYVRGLGEPKSGSSHSWFLKLTAIANIPLSLASLVIFILLDRGPYQEARLLLMNPLVALTLFLTFISVLYHMHLGMQTIIGDYVHALGFKLFLMISNTCFVVTLGVIVSISLLKILTGV